jgi:hypothetical protein
MRPPCSRRSLMGRRSTITCTRSSIAARAPSGGRSDCCSHPHCVTRRSGSTGSCPSRCIAPAYVNAATTRPARSRERSDASSSCRSSSAASCADAPARHRRAREPPSAAPALLGHSPSRAIVRAAVWRSWTT